VIVEMMRRSINDSYALKQSGHRLYQSVPDILLRRC
jgi:hypothetical protein